MGLVNIEGGVDKEVFDSLLSREEYEAVLAQLHALREMCWSGDIGLAEYDRREKILYDRFGETLTGADPYSFIEGARELAVEGFAEIEARILRLCGHYQEVAERLGFNPPRMIVRLLLFKDDGKVGMGTFLDVDDWEGFCPDEAAAVEYFKRVREGFPGVAGE